MSKHDPAPGRPTVADLAAECPERATDGGLLICSLPPGHKGWHHLCRPGTRTPVMYGTTARVFGAVAIHQPPQDAMLLTPSPFLVNLLGGFAKPDQIGGA